MQQAYFRFYGELNDLLLLSTRGQSFSHAFDAAASVKDAIEAFGVPHTEVDLILVNGRPEAFSYVLRDGDRISVYPAFRSLDPGPLIELQPRSQGEIRFVLDTHLGKLAAYLRMLGFDCVYRNDCRDEELARISASQQRTLLSRDRGLLKRAIVTRGYLLREEQPRQQLVEVVGRFGLSRYISPFRRCLHCNTLLEPVPEDVISDRLPPKTRQYYDEFHLCRECNRLYWKGSHYKRMTRLIEHTLASLGCSDAGSERDRTSHSRS